MDSPEHDIDPDAVSISSTAADESTMLPPHEFIELREMVQGLQVGFTAAMTELSNIQDEDKRLYDKLNDSKQEQEVQMRDMLQLIQTLKEQCDNIQCQIELSNKNQRRMEKQIRKLKSERRMSDDRQGMAGLSTLNRHQTSNGADANGMYTSPMLKSFIASLPLPEEMEDIEEHHSDSDESIAEVTQKSLLLTNALAQRAYEDSPQVNGENSNSSSEQDSKNGIFQTTEYRQNGHTLDQRRINSLSTMLSKKQVQRQKTAMSIVDSERNYCTTLHNLIENYSKVLRKSDSLSARDCSRIFPPSLTSIYEYHCSVLCKLEMRLARWRQQDIFGDIFGKFADTSKQEDIFAQYRDYIDNFTTALRTVRKLNKSSEKFCMTVSHCQSDAGGDHVSMISQLLAPVRRIPSLVLYIKKLLKYTDADHPDRFFLESSLNSFRSSLSSVNEAMERSVQKALSDCSNKRSLETSSWSSHEEEQRLSTATKDSGINSNCDLESHDEMSSLHYKPREHNSSLKKAYVYVDTTDSAVVYREQPARPKSMVDFLRYDTESSSMVQRRCKTPTIGTYSSQHSPIPYIEKPALKPSLSHSTPNLLDEPSYNTGSLRQSKTKHKVQFKNPPEEQSLRYQRGGSKKGKKRSITDTLRIIFNRRKASQSKNSNSDMSDSCCDLNSSLDEAPQPAPPHMFASNGESHQHPLTHKEVALYMSTETYEDENGDPYSVV